jgi:sugar lactone lactonase YvrE
MSQRVALAGLVSIVLASAGLAVTPAAAQPLAVGELVVADDGADAVLAVDAATGAKRVIASGGALVAPHGVAVDPASGRVYVADRDAAPNGQGAVIRIDPAGYQAGNPAANQQVVSSGGQLEEPTDVFVERGGTLLVADGGGLGGVIRVDPANGAQSRVFDFAAATGVAADVFGTVYAARSIGANEVRRAASGDTTPDLVTSNGFLNVNGHLAFEPDGTFVIVDVGATGSPDGQVIRVDPDLIDTGHPEVNQSLLSDAVNLVDPRGVALGAAGELYVTDPGAEAGAGAIYRVDPNDGAQTLVATGAPLDSPIGIDVARRAPRAGDIVVAESFPAGRVVLVDPASGAQHLVRSFAPLAPVDVEIDENGDVLVLLAAGGSGITPRVVRVDPATGVSALVHAAGPTGTNDFNVVERMVREGTHLFVADSATFVSPTFQSGAIFDVSLENGTKTLVTGGGDTFRALSIAFVPPAGDFLVGTTNNSQNAFDLLRVDRTNLARDEITTGGDILRPFDLVVDGTGAVAYVAASIAGAGNTGAVTAVELATGDTTLVTDQNEVFTPAGIAFDGAGDLLVTHRVPRPNFQYEAQVVRIDPEAADPTPVLVTAGGLLNQPEGLAVFAPEPGAGAAAGAALAALAACACRRRGARESR